MEQTCSRHRKAAFTGSIRRPARSNGATNCLASAMDSSQSPGRPRRARSQPWRNSGAMRRRPPLPDSHHEISCGVRWGRSPGGEELMKRCAVLGTLLIAGALSMALAAFQQPAAPAERVLVVDKLKDNLYVLKGDNSGGNSAVFIAGTGVVVVDTKNPGWGQPILDKIKTLTDKPVTTIINT